MGSQLTSTCPWLGDHSLQVIPPVKFCTPSQLSIQEPSSSVASGLKLIASGSVHPSKGYSHIPPDSQFCPTTAFTLSPGVYVPQFPSASSIVVTTYINTAGALQFPGNTTSSTNHCCPDI